MRLQSLDGWRGLTALLVVIFHLNVPFSFFQAAWLRNLVPVLEFFFMVSGFVMALGFHNKVYDTQTFWTFIVRRFGRVWPIHLAMLGILLAFEIFRFVFVARDSAFINWLKPE